MNDKIEKLRIANNITSHILDNLKEFILNNSPMPSDIVANEAQRLINICKVRSAFLGYKGYPSPICISLNDEVIHGLPSENKIIKKGDIVSLDLGVVYDTYCSDMAISFVNRKLSLGKKQKLIEDTRQALNDSIDSLKKAYPHCCVSHIISAIDKYKDKYGIVNDFGGHGIGKTVHEGTLFIPNTWEDFKKDIKLEIGTTFTIEPMLTLGEGAVKHKNNWEVVTVDNSLAAHFEYSIAITDNGVEVLK